MSLHQALRDHLAMMAKFMREQHLKHTKLGYYGMEDFVLREGRDMRLTPKKPRLRKGTPKECFSNSTDYVIRHPTHRYAEGYVMSADLSIAIHHAWVLNPAGQVLDPTLGWREGAAYVGVDFDTDFLLRRIRQSGYYGLFTDGIKIHDLVLGTDPDFNYRNEEAA